MKTVTHVLRLSALVFAGFSLAATGMVVLAASPPGLVSYQGVLRDASNDPQTGDFDMIFRFFSLAAAGDEILVDSHTAADGNPVGVGGGLFTVLLGGGVLADGSGPGVYSNLSEAFRDYPNVFLSVEVGGEVLAPRIRIVSAGYALNADAVDGKDSSELVDTSADAQSKAGTLAIEGTTVSAGGIGFPGGGAIPADANSVTILAGVDDTDAVGLQAGNDFTDGRIAINGNGPFEMRSGSGFFHFVNGDTGVETATVRPNGTLFAGGLEFTSGPFLTPDAGGLTLRGGIDDTDHVTLLAGNEISDGMIAVNGDGPMELRAGNGFFHFVNGVTGVEMATIRADGTLFGSGLEFSSGPFLTTDAAGVTIRGGVDDTDHVTLQAGNDLSDGKIAVNGDGPIELRSGNGFFHFNNGATDTERAVLNSLGDLQIDGGLTVDGNDVRFLDGGRVGANAGEVFVLAGADDADTVRFQAGNDPTDGDMHIYGSGPIDMRSGDGFFHFYDALGTERAALNPSGSLEVGGVLRTGTTTGAPPTYNHIGSLGTPDSGFMTTANDLYVANDAEIDSNLILSGSLRMHDAEASQTIFFFNGGSQVGDSFGWDDVQDRFELSDSLAMIDAIWVGSTTGAPVVYNRFGSAGTPGASMDVEGDVYIQNDLDVDGVTSFTGEIKAAAGVGFVQNHPYRPDLSIVYAAPAGDETATYTRGTARLAGGVARVSLDESFSWVTNPDLGLTAHVTPRGGGANLYVASLTTKELVVRGTDVSSVTGEAADGTAASADEVVFDYIVYGLRIGFEERSAVRGRRDPAPIPSPAVHEADYDPNGELRSHTPIERFKKMNADLGTRAPDLAASRRLREAIGEYSLEPEAPSEVEADASSTAAARPGHAADPEGRAPETEESGSRAALGRTDPAFVVAEGGQARMLGASGTGLAVYYRVSEPVEEGDVLVMDRSNPESLRKGTDPGDPAVVGVVSREPGMLLGSGADRMAAADPEVAARLEEARGQDDRANEARLLAELEDSFLRTHRPVAVAGIVRCKADATLGAIQVGDLLTVSQTPGHAMRAPSPSPGTVVGKALQTLDSGTGLIEVLVMLR